MVATISDEAEVMVKSRYYLSSQGTPMPQLPPWPSYTVKEAAEKTGYNEEYLRRLIRNKAIVAVKIGYMHLIQVESLENYIREMGETDDGRAGPRPKS